MGAGHSTRAAHALRPLLNLALAFIKAPILEKMKRGASPTNFSPEIRERAVRVAKVTSVRA